MKHPPELLGKVVAPIMTALLTLAMLAGLAGVAILAVKFFLMQIGGL